MKDYCVQYRCLVNGWSFYARSMTTIKNRLRKLGVDSGYTISTLHISDFGKSIKVVKVQSF